jgi:hypothetical protein
VITYTNVAIVDHTHGFAVEKSSKLKISACGKKLYSVSYALCTTIPRYSETPYFWGLMKNGVKCRKCKIHKLNLKLECLANNVCKLLSNV